MEDPIPIVEDCDFNWDTQYDFGGPVERRSSAGHVEDLFSGGPLSPHIHTGLNGSKKTLAHMWCENMSDQVQLLQQQVTTLADTQSSADDRYARYKSENAVLQARVNMLDEQIREMEIRCEERVTEEQKRCREAVARAERERDQQLSAANERLGALESETNDLRQEVGRLRGVAEGLRMGAEADARRCQDAQEHIAELNLQLQQTRDSERKLRSLAANREELIKELQSELERARREQSATPARHDCGPDLQELHDEIAALRRHNKSLTEAQEELQAQMLSRGVEEGRSLLDGVTGPLLARAPHSLAHELHHVTHDQLDGCDSHSEQAIQLEKMQKMLKEQQDVNIQLRTYIDGILLSIVEHYPQLLDIKYQKKTPS